MLDILFLNNKTGQVNYAVTDVTRIRYITPSEIGFDKKRGEETISSGCSFPQTERIEITHQSNSPLHDALIRTVPHE